MSSYTESPRIVPAHLPIHPLVWIGVATSRLLHAALTELRRRQAIRELRAFDDRMLADIGLQRRDIEHAVHFGRSSLLIRMPGT